MITMTLLSMGSTALAAAAFNELTAEAEYQQTDTAQVTVPMQFRDGATHMRVLNDVNGVAMAEGDIIFGDAKRYFSNQRSAKGLSNTVYGTVWPNGLVPYEISDQLSDSTAEKVRAAIEKWNLTGAVTLVERTTATASAYPNYIDFIDADQCASWVGFQNQGAQSIYTGSHCSEGSMIHEIGHALGLLHEHTRPDRDNFVRINWENIAEGKEHNFHVLEDGVALGTYDYESIMHYGTHFFSERGGATITALQNTGVQVGQREFISEGDRNSMIELYRSELAVVSSSPESVSAGDQLQLDLIVTNNTDTGANGAQLTTAVPAESELTSFASASWFCQQASAGADVVCQTPVLAANAQTQVSINLTTPDTPGVIALDSTLDSSTVDADLSNNTDRASSTVVAASNDAQNKEIAPPVIAAATPGSSTDVVGSNATTTEGGGGGAFGWLGLLLVFCRQSALRLRKPS